MKLPPGVIVTAGGPRPPGLPTAIHLEFAVGWPDAHLHELEQSLRVVARLEHGEDISDASCRS